PAPLDRGLFETDASRPQVGAAGQGSGEEGARIDRRPQGAGGQLGERICGRRQAGDLRRLETDLAPELLARLEERQLAADARGLLGGDVGLELYLLGGRGDVGLDQLARGLEQVVRG